MSSSRTITAAWFFFAKQNYFAPVNSIYNYSSLGLLSKPIMVQLYIERVDEHFIVFGYSLVLLLFYLRRSRQFLELWELLFLWGGQFALTYFSNKLRLNGFTSGWDPSPGWDLSPYSSASLGFINSLRGGIHTNQTGFLLLHFDLINPFRSGIQVVYCILFAKLEILSRPQVFEQSLFLFIFQASNLYPHRRRANKTFNLYIWMVEMKSYQGFEATVEIKCYQNQSSGFKTRFCIIFESWNRCLFRLSSHKLGLFSTEVYECSTIHHRYSQKNPWLPKLYSFRGEGS